MELLTYDKIDHQRDVNAFMAGVEDESIPAGLDIRLAVKRQLKWLYESPPARYFFDPLAANRVINFMELLHHTEGLWESPTLKLEPVQKWIVSCMYGWRHEETGFRLCRRVLISKARKNAKTTEAAALALYHLLEDGEHGPRCFAAAMTQQQARILTDTCRQMVRMNPHLKKYYGVQDFGGSQAGYLTVPDKNGKLEPLSRENHGDKDGFNTSAFVVDEYHAAMDNRMYEALENGTAARKQSMGIIISTAGANQNGPLFETMQYGRRVLTGLVENDHFFMANFHIDPDDDINDPRTWRKANPLLGVSVEEEFIANKIKEMKDRPGLEPGYRIKHLNQWVNLMDVWLNVQEWDACKSDFTLDDFRGEKCWVGLDLASRQDMAAMVILFERDGHFYTFPKYYLPEATILEQENEHYRQWHKLGHLDMSPGARTNYDRIETDLDKWRESFNVRVICIDPANSGNMMISLDHKGYNVSEYRQSVSQMSPALQDFHSFIADGKFHHDGHPITRWMVENAVVKYNDNGQPMKLVKLDKRKKNDGIVASAMALEVALVEMAAPAPMVYIDGKAY